MLRKPDNVQYFTAVMYNRYAVEDSEKIICELFGEPVLISEKFEFDHTEYYTKEMGSRLIKYFYAFEKPLEPSYLPEFKCRAIEKEDSFRVDGQRVINIDPGYLALEKVVVATTKNFTHRIYLDKMIYGDVQLVRKNSSYVQMPWSYSDYLRKEVIEFFVSLSKRVGGR